MYHSWQASELRKKLVRTYVWRISLYGSEIWPLRNLERKYMGSFKILCWRRIEKIKWSEKVITEVLERIGEKRTLLNNILCRKVNWIGHILRRNCLSSSWCHWRTDDRSERNRKKNNTAPWWIEKQKKILEAEDQNRWKRQRTNQT